MDDQTASQAEILSEDGEASRNLEESRQGGKITVECHVSMYTHVDLHERDDRAHKIIEACFLLHPAWSSVHFGHKLIFLCWFSDLIAGSTSAFFVIHQAQITYECTNTDAEALRTTVYEKICHDTCTQVPCHDSVLFLELKKSCFLGKCTLALFLSMYTHVDLHERDDRVHKIVEACFLWHLACLSVHFGHKLTF